MTRSLCFLLAALYGAYTAPANPLVVLSGSTSGSSTLLNGLVGYWKLDESSDGSVQVNRADSSGAGLTLTDENTTASGTLGGDAAADFESGNTERLVRAADDAALDWNGNQSFTIAFWVRFETSAVDQYLVSKWNTTGGQRQYAVGYGATADRLRILVSADGAAAVVLNADTIGAIANATDYFVVAWHDADADTINIQVNDGAVDSAAHSTGIFNGSATFHIGNRTTADHTDALMKKVGAWNRVLTAGERTTLAGNATHPF